MSTNDSAEIPPELAIALKKHLVAKADIEEKIIETKNYLKKLKEAKQRRETAAIKLHHEIAELLKIERLPPIEIIDDKTGEVRCKYSMRTSNTKKPVSMTLLRKVYMEVYGDEKEAEAHLKRIQDARPTVVREYIKRTNRRKAAK